MKANSCTRLSSYLYESTANKTYRNAANLTQNFIQSHFYIPSNSLVRDSISLTDCSYPNDWTLTNNAGLYLGAVSVLGNVASDPDLLHLYVPNLSFLFFHRTTQQFCPRADQLSAGIVKTFGDVYGRGSGILMQHNSLFLRIFMLPQDMITIDLMMRL